jgi:hypothetical protein
VSGKPYRRHNMTERETLILLIGIIEDAQAKAKQATYPDGYDRAVFDVLGLIQRELDSAMSRAYDY